MQEASSSKKGITRPILCESVREGKINPSTLALKAQGKRREKNEVSDGKLYIIQ